jgi:hypothetical protein
MLNWIFSIKKEKQMKRALRVFALLFLLGVPIGVRAQLNNGVVTITVTNVAANITVDRECNFVVIRENAATPTAVFDITIGVSATAHHYAAGTQYVFAAQKGSGGAPFKSGTTIGTIVATTAGPFTFTADESYGDPSLAAKNGTGSAAAATDATLSTSDITTNNVSTSKHGFAPKGDGNAAHYLDGTGAYTPPAGGDTTAKYIVGDTAVPGDLGNAKSWPSLFNSPDIPPSSRNAMDDEFDGASLNSPNNIWTWRNQGSAAITFQSGTAFITAPSNGSADTTRFIGQATPSPPYTFVTKIGSHIPSRSNYAYGGIVLFETATSKSLAFGPCINGSGNFQFCIRTSAGGETAFGVGSSNSYSCFGIGRASTTITFYASVDCVIYDALGTQSITTSFTTAPDTIGVGVHPYSQITGIVVDYFRRTL